MPFRFKDTATMAALVVRAISLKTLILSRPHTVKIYLFLFKIKYTLSYSELNIQL